MNMWTQLSIDLANQKNYLDLLFRVYPTIPEACRDINSDLWNAVEKSLKSRNNLLLIQNLLKMELFPIKDSYVAYLRHDPEACGRNPETINRLAGRIYEMSPSQLYEKCSAPKETNRQIGPLFKRWIKSGAIGVVPVSYDKFVHSKGNAILDGSDQELMHFAQEKLGYQREKGLDFLGRFGGRYVIGEAKFLTDCGGHQNAQVEDAFSTLNTPCDAIKIAILDGVCYIPGSGKMYGRITSHNDMNIMSALVLREFLYQV